MASTHAHLSATILLFPLAVKTHAVDIKFRFTTTYATSAYHQLSFEFESRPLAAGRRISPGTSVSSTNKTDHHDISEILLKVTLNTITQNPLISHTTTISKQRSTRWNQLGWESIYD
jgi:hypothetical protein